MKKVDSLRRYLLPCFSPSSTKTTTHTTTTKKRLSTSLRDDIPPPEEKQRNNKNHQENAEKRGEKEGREEEKCSSTTSTDDDDDEEGSVNNYPPPTVVPPRSSRSMVIGTIFGHRRGHVSFCIQHDRLDSRPSLLLEFSIPTQLLVKEMRCGLVRIALECSSNRSDLSSCSLHSVPIWTMCINGRKVGYATRRRANDKDRMILKTMKSTTVGAGVIPAEMARNSSVSSDHHHHQVNNNNNNNGGNGGEGPEDIGGELIYMRANYERVIGSIDSESYHLVNPGGGPGHDLSVFLLRSR